MSTYDPQFGRELAACLTQALEAAGVEGDQKRHVLAHFTLAWGQRLIAEIEQAEFDAVITSSWTDDTQSPGAHPRRLSTGRKPEGTVK